MYFLKVKRALTHMANLISCLLKVITNYYNVLQAPLVGLSNSVVIQFTKQAIIVTTYSRLNSNIETKSSNHTYLNIIKIFNKLFKK